MILNLAKNIHLYCGNHEKDYDAELIEHEGAPGLDMFYSCPKYYDENRKPGERACSNRLTISEYQRMIDHISEIIEMVEAAGNTVNLTGHRWEDKSRGYEFKILKHTKDYINISVKNLRAIRMG